MLKHKIGLIHLALIALLTACGSQEPTAATKASSYAEGDVDVTEVVNTPAPSLASSDDPPTPPPAPTATGGDTPTPSATTCECPSPTNGEDGVDGTSCSVTQTSSGATIACDDGTTATLTNGTPGADGQSIVGPMGPQGPAGQSVVGPRGPAGADSTVPGPQGPQGERGPAGADGKDAVLGSTYVVHEFDSPPSAGTFGLSAYCDEGDILISGGCHAFGAGAERLAGSYPGYDPTTKEPTNWHCRAHSLATSHTLNAFAICMEVSK